MFNTHHGIYSIGGNLIMNSSDEMERNELIEWSTSRRRFLTVAAAVGAVAGMGGTASVISSAQEDAPQQIELIGRVSGWVGVAPSSIAGQTNPPLSLEAGTDYELTWTNGDGAPHNFNIEDTQGSVLVETEIMSEQGATQTVTFTARESMAEYFCAVHPQSMRGEIQLETRQKTPTPTPTEETEQTPIEEDGQDTDQGQQYFFPKGPTVGVEQVAGDGDLTAPTDFAVAPEATTKQFITDQTGQIYVLTADGLRDEPFMNISERLVDLPRGEYDERGLLGLEFHPNFAENRLFYVHYSAPPNENTPEGYDHVEVISEFTATADGMRGCPATECKLLQIQHPQTNHDAGPMAFGPDGYLYIPMGDGGGADDVGLGHVEDWYERNEGGNGQDIYENLLGNIIRINVDIQEDGKPYGIPNDNPLVGTAGIDELYAWGFRNPFGISFDSEGRLFVADAGQNLFEEANIIEKGGNYGWNVKEATHCFSTAHPNEPFDDCPDSVPEDVPGQRGGEELIDPIVEYPHRYKGQQVGLVIVGGGVYENDTITPLQGKYVFGEWSRSFEEPAGRLLAARPNNDNDSIWGMEELLIGGDRGLEWFVRGVGLDADGNVYVLVNKRGVIAGNTGAVLKLVPGE
jgi:glucose/arabinose dehydrogenase